MNGVVRIEHTVQTDKLVGGRTIDTAAQISAKNYIGEVFDALEDAYPEARVIIVEILPGAPCDSPSGCTTVETQGDVDADEVTARVQAIAREIYDGGSWRVYQLDAA
jgi:hypothetical protein